MAAGRDPFGLSFTANARYAYTVDAFSQALEGFARDSATGAMTSLGTFSGGTLPEKLIVDPSGKFVYDTNAGNYRTPPPVIFGNAINPQTGALSPIPGQGEGFATGDIPAYPVIVVPN
jgi:DNA-binding beta-propeller fold protein YncE